MSFYEKDKRTNIYISWASSCWSQKHTNYFLSSRVHQEITDDIEKYVKGEIKVEILDFMDSKFIAKSLSKSKALSNKVPKKEEWEGSGKKC